jgi:hypothetical protein
MRIFEQVLLVEEQKASCLCKTTPLDTKVVVAAMTFQYDVYFGLN